MNLPEKCALSVTQRNLNRHRFLTSAPQCLRLTQNQIMPVIAKKTKKISAKPHKVKKEKDDKDKVVPPPRVELGTC